MTPTRQKARSLKALSAAEVSKQVKDQAKALLRKLHNMPPRCSVEGRAFKGRRSGLGKELRSSSSTTPWTMEP